MQKIKDLFKSVESRHGSFSTVLVAIVVGIAIIFNLIVGQLPENIRNVDISNNKIYDITDTSKKLVKKLDKKVVLNIVAEKKSVDERITTFVKKYAAMSSDISVNWVDPILHPSALATYDTEGNSIVVSCKDTEKMQEIPFTDIIVYDQSSYYTTGTATESQFDGEGQITSAINYVTNETTKTIYRTAGHGEATLSGTVTDMMEKSNLTVAEVNMMIASSIPEDCDLLLMNAPTTDLSEAEKATIATYMQNGGKMMVMLSSEDVTLPNLETLLAEYGLQKEQGYIADTSRSYQGNAYYIFPEISATGSLAEGLSSNMVLIVNAFGFTQVTPVRDTIQVTPFMQTSDNGYAVTEEAEKQGTYIIGAVATEDKSKLTVIGGGSMVDAQITDSFSTVENLPLFMNAVTSNFEDVENVSIEAKNLQVELNTVKYTGLFSMLVIFGIPLITLIIGAAVWWKRRRA